MDRISYPRPDWIRKETVLLDGEWDFSFEKDTFDMKINVPFCYQSELSGVADKTKHTEVWYRRHFKAEKRGSVILWFGAVDYYAEIYVNGKLCGTHSGGFNPFSFDITRYIEDENILVVRAIDHASPYLPVGKQRWTERNFGCWYTPVTGIWQSIWLEYAGSIPALSCHFLPSAKDHRVDIELLVDMGYTGEAEIAFSLNGASLGSSFVAVDRGVGKASHIFEYDDVRGFDILWSPSCPNLIDAEIEIKGGEVHDTVSSYFGLRDITVDNGSIYLNGNVVYQRLVLDQGFWAESLLTPPSAEALEKDIEAAIECGFNGARKHQKAEDPRYYYIADKMGFLIWGELASWHRFSDDAVKVASKEMLEQVSRDYNHPSIITWVPLNESWGVGEIMSSEREAALAKALYYLVKAYDPSRLISANDGWEQIAETDIFAIHDYSFSSVTADKYDNPKAIIERNRAESRALMQSGESYRGQPIILTEFGGIAFDDGSDETWGYYGKIKSGEDFVKRLGEAVRHLSSSPLAGFCYTQLTDVEQETNGLMRSDRTFKLSKEEYRKVFLPEDRK